MRHRKAGVKLNRTSSHRSAMFRNMVTSIFKYERIRTTDAKAKEIKRWADRMITLAKRGDLHARRQVMAVLREKDVVAKLFEQAGKRFGDVAGGYTRIIKLGRRPGDAAPVSLVELIGPAVEEKKKGKKKPAKTPSRKTPKKSAGAEKSAPPPETILEKTEKTPAPDPTDGASKEETEKE
ncbi:MAG: 50S ribosomal protein L17 [Deltaproteobacteria bacterium]|nr:50S ribosomal protein L17 [Deltaproteobacteria bacterium]